MKAKFKVGDLVRLGRRCPPGLRARIRDRTRRIVATFYDDTDQCRYYELGGQGKGTMGYLFRSYMLLPVSKDVAAKMGRPRKTPVKAAR